MVSNMPLSYIDELSALVLSHIQDTDTDTDTDADTTDTDTRMSILMVMVSQTT